MARKQRLEPSFQQADAFIGIATNLSAIQLVHFINRESWLNLVRETELPVYSEKSDSLNYFRFFYYQDEDLRSDFCLLCNQSDGLFLLPTQKQFGYFLLVNGAIPDGKVKQLISSIKSIAGVQLAASIPQEPIKALGPLLEDLELHLTDLKQIRKESVKRIMPSSEEQ